jgi:hypothetical protein
VGAIFFKQITLNKIWFPKFPLEITVRIDAPTKIFSLGTPILTVIQGNLGKQYFIGN